MRIEDFLPRYILEKAIVSGNEYGWRREDYKQVVEVAYSHRLAIVGGQIQFKLPDGTCEMYWYSYDTNDRLKNESWLDYCLRTKSECLKKFRELPSNYELVREGIENFDFLKAKDKISVVLEKYFIFIIYLDKSVNT